MHSGGWMDEFAGVQPFEMNEDIVEAAAIEGSRR